MVGKLLRIFYIHECNILVICLHTQFQYKIFHASSLLYSSKIMLPNKTSISIVLVDIISYTVQTRCFVRNRHLESDFSEDVEEKDLVDRFQFKIQRRM